MTAALARATLGTSAVFTVRLLMQIGTLLLVARLLGAEGYGAFAGVAALAMLLGTLSTFGTHFVLLAEVSRDPSRSTAIVPYAVTTTLVCSGGLMGLYLLIALTLLEGAGISIGALLALGIAELLLQPLLTLPCAQHHGRGRIVTAQLLTTAPLALRLLAAAAVWLLQPADPLPPYAYGYLAASAVALIVATLSTPGAWPPLSHWRLPRLRELRQASGYAVLSITATSPAELDKTLALRLLPPSAAGVYAAATRVVGALTLPVIAMLLAAMPRLIREHRANTALLRWLFAVTLGYSVMLAAALWFAAPLFVWLFGSLYQDLDRTIRWLCLAVPGMALRITAGSVLMSMDLPWMRVGFELAGLGTLAVAATVLAPRFGLPGMSMALACAEWLMALVGSVLIMRALGTVTATRAA